MPASHRSRPPLPGGPYLVVGLARSGVAAALALRARGEQVIGVDLGPASSPDLAAAAQRLSAAGVEVHLDASGDALAARAGTLIKSPGVPASAPVAAARARGLPVLGELELAWRLLENEFVAVTGTNGKTTTTEWIGHIHREAALPVAVAGNGPAAAAQPLHRRDRHQRQDHHGRAAGRDPPRRLCRWRWPETWAPRCRRWSARWIRAPRSSARCRASSSRTPRRSRPSAPCC